MMPHVGQRSGRNKAAVMMILHPERAGRPGAEGPDDEGEDRDAGIRSVARDLVAAVHAKNEPGVASALRSAFSILGAESPDEGDLMDEEPAE